MIVIGSYAANARGIRLPRPPADVDLVGTRQELEPFRTANRDCIESEQEVGSHRIHFILRHGLEWRKVEFDFENSGSDRMLHEMCSVHSVPILKSTAFLPSVNILYLTKRAHANLPVNFQKTLKALQYLKPHTEPFSGAEQAYYRLRRKECADRLALHPSRFTLDVSNSEFFATSDHIRKYVHDDMHKAIAFTRGKPLYDRCKRDLASARIEQDMFLALAPGDRIRMLQEEFMVVGLERYFLHDRELSPRDTYGRGMLKTIRDLFTGWFQDYCLDHADELAILPPHNFRGRFLEAERNGELRPVHTPGSRPETELERACRLFSANRYREARQAFLKLNEAVPPPGDETALYYLGRIAARNGRFEIAVTWLRRAIEVNGARFQAWNELGKAYRQLGRNDEAINCFREAVRKQPGFLPALVNLGRLLEKCGRPRRAMEAYRRALKLNPDDRALAQRLRELTGGPDRADRPESMSPSP